MLSEKRSEEILGSRACVHTERNALKMTLSEKGGRNIEKVLAKNAEVLGVEITVGAGEITVSGSVQISAVCDVAGGGVLAMEYVGKFEFAHRAEGIFPPCQAEGVGIVREVRVLRVSGCDLVCEVIFDVQEYFAASASETCVVDIGGGYSAAQKCKLTSFAKKQHEFVASEEVEVFDGISAVLFSAFAAEVVGVARRRDSVVASGNVHGYFVFANLDGKIARKEISFPFREEFSAPDAADFACRAKVGSCKVICEVNEVRKVSIATCDVEIVISAWGFSAAEYAYGSDFFCTDCEIVADMQSVVSSEFCGSVQTQKRFASTFAEKFEETAELGILSSRIASVAPCESEVCAGFCGEIATTVYACSGETKTREFLVPFRVDFQSANLAGKAIWCDVCVCEIDVRMASGGVEIFGTVAACGIAFGTQQVEVATDVRCGEAKVQRGCGFVMYNAENGESLLDIAKAVNAMPAAIEKQNPKLVFPTKEGDKVIVWG